LCEPLETTANGKRLVVEDSAACQKTIQTPVAQQVLKTDGAGNLNWTNGANNTVLGKDYAGKIDFVNNINNILQSSPVDLGIQPLTTTGAIASSSLTSTGAAKVGSLTTTGVITATSAVFNVSSSGNAVRITQSGTGQSFVVEDSANPDSSQFVINNDGNVGIGDSTPSQKLTVTGNIKPSGNIMLTAGQHVAFNSNAYTKIVRNETTNRMEFFTNNVLRMFISDSGTVSLQGLSTYANNAAAITGGLVVNDIYKTTTGELRIVV
jgi:hypothetical protein